MFRKLLRLLVKTTSVIEYDNGNDYLRKLEDKKMREQETNRDRYQYANIEIIKNYDKSIVGKK